MTTTITTIPPYEVFMVDEQDHYSVFCRNNEDRFIFATRNLSMILMLLSMLQCGVGD